MNYKALALILLTVDYLFHLFMNFPDWKSMKKTCSGKCERRFRCGKLSEMEEVCKDRCMACGKDLLLMAFSIGCIALSHDESGINIIILHAGHFVPGSAREDHNGCIPLSITIRAGFPIEGYRRSTHRELFSSMTMIAIWSFLVPPGNPVKLLIIQDYPCFLNNLLCLFLRFRLLDLFFQFSCQFHNEILLKE